MASGVYREYSTALGLCPWAKLPRVYSLYTPRSHGLSYMYTYTHIQQQHRIVALHYTGLILQIPVKNIPCSGYFSGGKIFVSSEFLASSWKNVRGCGILNHTLVLCGTVSWVKFLWFASQPQKPQKFYHPKIPAIRYIWAE